jgi:hypothetical protein
MKTNRVLLTLVLTLLAAVAQADPISYQARLTDDASEPLVGEHALSFALYYQEEGGSAVWTEALNPTLDADGLFSVLLGDGSPLDSLLGSDNPGPAWFEITVDSDVLAPRRRIAGAARAYLANDAEKLAGLPAGAYAQEGHDHNELYPTHLVLENSDGDGPNAGTPRVHWDVLHGVPAIFADGGIKWSEIDSIPAGFADGVDDTGSGGGNTLDQAYDQGGSGAGRTIMADNGPVKIEGPGGFRSDGLAKFGGNTASHGSVQLLTQTGDSLRLALNAASYGGRIKGFDKDGDTAFELGVYPDGDSGWLDIVEENGWTGVSLTGSTIDGGGSVYVDGGSAGSRYAYLMPASTGTNAVMLPDSSLDANEILDEPGIARSCLGGIGSNSYLQFDGTDTSYQTVLSVTITTPRSGYILVRGIGTVTIRNCSTYTFVMAQIDTVEASWRNDGDQVVGNENIGTGEAYHQSLDVQDVYYRSAGTHTFYLRARHWGFSTGECYIIHPDLTAIYLPTSYGAVATYEDRSGSAPPSDLRVLELRDARAEAAAERARRELIEAQLKQHRGVSRGTGNHR